MKRFRRYFESSRGIVDWLSPEPLLRRIKIEPGPAKVAPMRKRQRAGRKAWRLREMKKRVEFARRARREYKIRSKAADELIRKRIGSPPPEPVANLKFADVAILGAAIKNLPSSAIKVLIYLLSIMDANGKIDISVNDIICWTGFHRNTVLNSLHALNESGLASWAVRGQKAPGRYEIFVTGEAAEALSVRKSEAKKRKIAPLMT